MLRQKFSKFLLILLAILQVFDGLFTYIGIKEFGIWLEGNPIVKYIISSFGPCLGLLTVKTLCIFLIFLTYDIKEKINTLALGVLVFLDILYLLAVITWAIFLLEKGLI